MCPNISALRLILLVLSLISGISSTSFSQGWIIPLGKAEGTLLEKLSDGTYFVRYHRANDINTSILAKISETGEILDSVSISERIYSIKEYNGKYYYLGYSRFWKSDTDLQNLELLHQFTGGTNVDTVLYHFVKNDPSFIFCGKQDNQNCQSIFTMDINNQAIDSLFCLPPYFSSNGNAWKLGASYYLIIHGAGSSIPVYVGLSNGNTATNYVSGSFDTYNYMAVSADKIGIISKSFHLLDSNFTQHGNLSQEELTFSEPSMEVRAGITPASDGGFYYSAYRTDPNYYPYVILGKINNSGGLEWKKGYYQYIFKYPAAITESHDGNSCLILVQDALLPDANDNLFLIKTYPDGNIGVDEYDVMELKVFPNPAQDYINILLPDNKPVTITIYNSEGRLMRKENTDNNAGSDHTIQINNFPAGLYYVRMQAEYRAFYSKFMKI